MSARVERRPVGIAVVGENGTEISDCTRFLERLRVRGLSPCTVEAYAYDLLLIHRWLSATGPLSVNMRETAIPPEFSVEGRAWTSR